MPTQVGFQEAVVRGSESRTRHPRWPPQRDFTWMPGTPPNPWPACWGTLTGFGSASAPPLFPGSVPQSTSEKSPRLFPQPRHGVQGMITSAGGMRSGWAPGQVPSDSLDHTLGQGGTPTRLRVVCLGKRNVSLAPVIMAQRDI